MIILPIFVNTIAGFQNANVTYNNSTENLNEAIIDILEGNNEPAEKKASLQLELQKNIVKANPAQFGAGGGSPPDITSSEYRNKLYQYVMHVTNDTDVTGIAIPQELKAIIRPIYLTGEQTITLKRKLVEVF